MKYRFETVTEADVLKELTENDFADIEHVIQKSLPRGMKFIEFKHTKLSGNQSTMVEPSDSISDMVAKLKSK